MDSNVSLYRHCDQNSNNKAAYIKIIFADKAPPLETFASQLRPFAVIPFPQSQN
jgi:hypothetical protein